MSYEACKFCVVYRSDKKFIVLMRLYLPKQGQKDPSITREQCYSKLVT
uniref:Uncharacterized protein n=1 Tax=Arundo donax TaxID=35708 RepID=A0A0A9E518_ARUDO